MIAAEYPNPGSVSVIRAHATPGPTGWYGNRHNDAVGWYWYQATLVSEPMSKGEVHKRRDAAMADAESVFTNIIGWRDTGRGHYWYALVAPDA